VGCLLLVSCAVAAAEPEENAESLGVRRRQGSFSEVEQYCRQRLALKEIAPEEQAQLTIELARTLTEHATQLRAGERAPLWQECYDVVNRFVRQHPKHPRRIAVTLEAALAALAQGELERQEAELTDPAELLDRPRQALRTAIAQLKLLDQEVSRARVSLGQQGSTPSERAALGELDAIEVTIQFQLARAFRNQALCYPAGSADRISALQQAVGVLVALGRLPDEQSLAWTARVEEVTCYRLLGQLDKAESKLAALNVPKTSADARPRALAEQLRLALAQGRIDEAILAAERSASDREPPDLVLAKLEVILAAWRRASERHEKRDAAGWEKSATEVVRRFDRTYSPYWSRRAENLLAGAIAESPGTENLDVLARAGDSLYRRGRVDEALEVYDRAARQAAKRSDVAKAFELAFKAATVEHGRKRYAEAAKRYRQLALAARDQPKAAEAHLMAIFDRGQELATSDPAAVADYANLIEEHLSKWPKSSTAGDAAFRLAAIREHQQAWAQAVTAYQHVASEHARRAAAIEGTASAYRAWLSSGQQSADERKKLAVEAVRYFENLVVDPNGMLPARWSAAERAAVLAAAEIWLIFIPNGYGQAEQVLNVALDRDREAPAPWKGSAQVLLVWSLAGQGRFDKAAPVLNSVAAANPQDLMRLLSALDGLKFAAGDKSRTQLAKLQLQVIGRVQPQRKSLSKPESGTLDRLHAMALADSGALDDAVAMLERLAREDVDNIALEENLASVLLRTGEPKNTKRALENWTEVERRSLPGSARWFRATLGRAQAQLALGNKSQARATIKLAEQRHPDLGGPTLRKQFLSVLERCAD